MNSCTRWLLSMLLFGAAVPQVSLAQLRDPVTDLNDARRVFVPIEELDVVIERDKQGVILSRAKFDVLMTQAKANAEKNSVPAGIGVIVTQADYVARIAGDQLLISVVSELNQFEDDWRETPFGLQRLAIEKASLDDVPALIGRHPDGSVSLFTNTRGKHTLKLDLSTELGALGSDQVAAFSLLKAPSGSLTLSLPAGKRLLVGNLQLQRPANLDQVADYNVAVGGLGGLQLRITDRAAENAADSLTFATTGYGLNVAPGEVTWHALTTLQVFGKPVDRLTFSVPSQLEIADVEATGLESWDLTDDPNEPKRTNISLTFGQAFDGARKISFKGVMSVDTGKPWAVPPLRIASVTSHIGQVIIQHAAGVRLRVEETSGVRRANAEQKPTTDMPDDIAKFNATEFLRFDVWQPDFTLRLATQPKQREVQAAVAAVLDVNATGLELQAALTIETHFAPLFELDMKIPSEWQVLSVNKDNVAIKWQIVGLDEPGVNQLRIMLEPALAAEATGLIRLSLRRDVEGWPVELEPIVVNLPELFLPQSNLTEGTLVVRGDDDLDLVAYDLTGLDPQPLKADFERLRFESQDTRFAGKLKIIRKPSRIAAQTVTMARIDPQTFHTFLQAVVEVEGGGVRTLKVALPENTGTALRFDCPGPRIVEQKPATPNNGERIWTLQFDQRLRGQALIVCDIELPRGEAKEFVVPQWRFVDAERQNGYFAVEASGEQRLTITANDAEGNALAEVDPLDLPGLFYQTKERIVAVHRAAALGTVFSISEEKFEKLPVPTAICPLLEVSTILGRTGELQHRATFYLNVVGVQGLHITLPSDPRRATLWATLVDGHPVEVRRSGDVYLVPLTALNLKATEQSLSVGPGGQRQLQLFYRSEVDPVSQIGRLIQEPPTLTVESGQRAALPIEILEQKWNLHYPNETRLVESHSPLEPLQPLDSTSLLWNWNSNLRVPTIADLGGQLLAVIIAIGIIALLTYGFRTKTLLVTQVVLVFAIFAVIIGLMLPAVQQSRESSRRAQARNEMKALELARELETDRPMDLAEDLYSSEKSGFVGNKKVPQKKMAKPPASAKTGAAAAWPDLNDKLGKDMLLDFAQKEEKDPNGPIPQPPAAKEPALGQMAGEGGVEGREVFEGKLSLENRQTQVFEGLLSLNIDFVPPAGSREKTFHYVGADTSLTGIPLKVDYVDRHSGAVMRVFMMALIAMIGWFVRKTTSQTKVGLGTLLFVTPLVLLPLVPMSWQSIVDGGFFGSLIAITIWLTCGWIHYCQRCFFGASDASKLVTIPTSVTTMIFAMILSTTTFAAENEQALVGKPATTLIIPFDAGTEPLASERVFLSHDQFLQLYQLANPDKVSHNPAPQAGGVFEAVYAAKLVPNVQTPDESMVEVTARYAVRSFVDGQLVVELPVGQVSALSAKLDGQTAALIANPGCFKVAVSKSGLHVIDFTFSVPARLSGTTGSFALPLLAIPTGKLVFELPSKDLSVRVNGSSTVFRRVTQGETQALEFPVDKGGEVSIAWQPQQSQGAAAAVVHVDSVEAITLVDAGTSVSHGFAYRVRQGGIADTTFSLPDTLRLQAVNGPDVGGWELQGEGAARKLRVIFRRNVTDQTRLTIETFLDAKVGNESTVIPVPQIAPQEVTTEIGQLAVFAGYQFSVRAEQVELLTQVDSDKFATQVPVSRPNVAPQLAYRFSKRPFTLNLRLTRQESQAHVMSQQAAMVTLRKLNLTTRLRYNLSGAPRSTLSVQLPENFVLLDAQATGLRDWYLAKKDDSSILNLELKAPMLGLIEVVLTGFTPRDNLAATIQFPQPLEVNRLESMAAVWLEEGFVGTLVSFDGWRSVDASQVTGELRAIRQQQPVQFAFLSMNSAPSAIVLKLSQSTPKLSANGLSMVTVTDVAVIYTLALQWQIDSAKTDTLTLTTPNWLAGKLNFQGNGLREATHADAGNDRIRWTLHLRTPLSGKYFATATATLPPAAEEVLAPALVFENEQKALDTQRQFVLLINSSLSQLTSVDPTSMEAVQREDLPLVVQQEFVDQATELVRVKSLLTAPKWSLHKFAQQQSAPASINVADLTTILTRDGTYRGQAVYTIKNRSRQFLALKIPESTELLSVFVAGQPSRAVTTKLASLKGALAHLIALPKTSAASLSFPVKIVWRGHLDRGLPSSSRFIREEYGIPAPQIVSQQEDADFGIPVARTRWTVYLPEDFDAQAVRSTSKHNLSLTDDTDSTYGSALLQEANELLGFLEASSEINRRNRNRNNLKQLGLAAGNLQQLVPELNNYSGNSEFSKNRAEVIKRLSEFEKLANDERQKEADSLAKQVPNPSGFNGAKTNFRAKGIVDGEEIAQEQRGLLLLGNGATGIHLPSAESKPSDSNFNFELQMKEAEKSPESVDARKADNGKVANGNNPNVGSRSQLRMSNTKNIDELNSTVTSNTFSRNAGNGLQVITNNTTQSGNGIANLNDQSLIGNYDSPAGQSPSQTNLGSVYAGNGTFSGMGGMGGGGGQFADGRIHGGGLKNLSINPGLPANSNELTVNQPWFDRQPMGIIAQNQPANTFGDLALPRLDVFNVTPQNSQFAGGAAPNDPTVRYYGTLNPDMNRPQGQRLEDRLAGGMPGQAAMAQQAGGGRRGAALGVNANPAWKQVGGLSLGIELPVSGRKIVFTKTGGDPKLALAIRPNQSVRHGINLVWSAVWILIGLTVLLTIRMPSGLNRLVKQLPLVAAVLGVLGYCVLPSPISLFSFVIFLVGTFIVFLRRRTATINP